MNKQEVYDFLKQRDIVFEIVEHEAIFNMEEASKITLPHREAEAKNLFVRDDKKRNYYLIVVLGDKRIDLKEFRKQNGTRALSFASEDDLRNILHLEPGSVTPLGILNDEEKKVHVYLDEEFLENDLIGVHPNENTATIFLKANDLIRIIEEHGNAITIVNLKNTSR